MSENSPFITSPVIEFTDEQQRERENIGNSERPKAAPHLKSEYVEDIIKEINKTLKITKCVNLNEN